jgi:hypothetical protein
MAVRSLISSAGQPRARGFVAWVGTLGVVLTALLAGDEIGAQAPYSTACRTSRGYCPISPAPNNAACRCYSDPGRVVPPPSNWRNACQTQQGRCQTPYFYPVGNGCRCGNWDGRIVN